VLETDRRKAEAPADPGAKAAKPAPETPPPLNTRALEIKPTGRPGWAADRRPVAELGRKVDAALAAAKEALCESETIFDVAGDKATAKLAFRIRDEDTYAVEWVEPSSKAEVNSVVRDGARVAVRFAGKQGSARAWARAAGTVGLQTFLDNPTRAMLAGFESGQLPWTGLFADLEAGKGGFKTTRESSKQSVGGKMREIVRVVSRSDGGDSVEALVDGATYLPLTLRVKRGNGSSYLWTGKWARGGQHQESSFRLP
jgi:hypothetical protein